MRTRLVRGVIAVFALAAIAYLGPKMIHALTHITTDDAYIQATIVPVSAEVEGKAIRVFVDDNRAVAAGDSLIQIDPAGYKLAVEAKTSALATAQAEEHRAEEAITQQEKAKARAQAEWNAAQTKVKQAERDRERQEQLLQRGSASQSLYDEAQTNAEVAKASAAAAAATLAQAEANLASLPTDVERTRALVRAAETALRIAQLDLERTVVRAPIAGRVARKNVDPGKYVTSGQPLLSIVQADAPWLVANFKETQIRKMRPEQPVEIRIDAYPGHVFRGHIGSFQPGTGAVFSLLPAENATGNFVKVTQRVPVKILIDSPPDPVRPLYPGLSANASVELRGVAAAAPR